MKQVTLIFVLLLLVATGCSNNAITVGDEHISKKDFELAVKERLESHKMMNVKVDEQAVKKAVSEELVAGTLLVREAKAKNIVVSNEEVQKTIEGIRNGASEQQFREALNKKGISYEALPDKVRNNLFISKLLAFIVKDDAITEAEMKDFYAKSRGSFIEPDKEFVAILQINAEEEARKVLGELKKGADFDTVAKNETNGGNASSTDYGWIEPGTIPSADLATALKTAKLNVFSGPHKGKDGTYYFFRIKKKQPARAISYEEAKAQVKNILLERRKQGIAAHIIEIGRKTAAIKVNI